MRRGTPASLNRDTRVASHLQFTFGWASPHPGEAAASVLARAERLMAADRAG
jgi:hypothetical protein